MPNRRAVCPSCHAWGVVPAAEVDDDPDAIGWRCRGCAARWDDPPGPLQPMMLVRGAWSSPLHHIQANHVLSRRRWTYDAELVGAADGRVFVRFDGQEVSLRTDRKDRVEEAIARGVVGIGTAMGRSEEFDILVIRARQTTADLRDDVWPIVMVRLADGWSARRGALAHPDSPPATGTIGTPSS